MNVSKVITLEIDVHNTLLSIGNATSPMFIVQLQTRWLITFKGISCDPVTCSLNIFRSKSKQTSA